MSKGSLGLAGILSSSKSYGDETLTIAWRGANDQGAPREQTTRYNEDNSWRDEIEEFAEAVLRDKPIVNGSSEEAWKTLWKHYQRETARIKKEIEEEVAANNQQS